MDDADRTVSIAEFGGGILLIEAIGEIDASSAPRLQRQLLAALEERRQGLVLELSAVTYMDSSGIGAVVAAYAEARARDVRLVVVCGGGHVADRLRVMGLDALLDPVSSLEEARSRLGAA